MPVKMVIFTTVATKKKSWYFVGCSKKVLLGSTKKGNFLKRKEPTFLFLFFLLRILAIHQNPLSFALELPFYFFSVRGLVDPNKAGSIWILYASARNRAILRSFTAEARETLHITKKISTLIVIYNRALQAKRLHWKRKGVS